MLKPKNIILKILILIIKRSHTKLIFIALIMSYYLNYPYALQQERSLTASTNFDNNLLEKHIAELDVQYKDINNNNLELKRA